MTHRPRSWPRVLLGVVHGVLLMAITFMFVLAEREDRIFGFIVDQQIDASLSEREAAIKLLHVAHDLISPRATWLGQDAVDATGFPFLESSDLYLSTGGACGVYAQVLGRLLQQAGYPTRIAQMRCEQIWGCHIIVETMIGAEWVVLDPLYNIFFEWPDGKLASAHEVGENWKIFKIQIPPDYDPRYRYEEVRYTNWSKIPVLMPAARQGLEMLIGAKLDGLSLRSYFLNLYEVWGIALLGAYGGVVALTMFAWLRGRTGRGARVEKCRLRKAGAE